MSRKSSMTITDLPTDVLTGIMRHLQEDGWQQDYSLDDVAALRSTCRSLRHATDMLVTHAKFPTYIDADELHSVTRRCAGD
jgi:F-box domain